MSSWEDARRCTFHGTAGKELDRTMGQGSLRGSKIITLECENGDCPVGTWIVQIRPDGTIPEPTTQRDKQFHPIPGWQQERGKLVLENLQDELAKSAKPGAEIHNPHTA